MARKKSQDSAAGLVEAPPAAEITPDNFPATADGVEGVVIAPAAAAPQPPTAPAPRRYRVSLNCPTPLRDKTLDVEAAHEGEARLKFDEHNGICGSVHPYSVMEV